MIGEHLAGNALPSPPEVSQVVVADGNAQVAVLGSGNMIVQFQGGQTQMPPVPAVALNSLPRDTPHFTDRRQALDRIFELGRVPGNKTDVITIDGMPGIGKTALAIHAAYELTSVYSDAQFYLDLHANSHGRTPVDPASGLETLLRVLGVPEGDIPSSLDARAALWRAHLATKKALIVLDNALNSSQVQPLLPGSGRSLVIITSRRRLSVIMGAVRVPLDVLPTGDAADLFVSIVGPKRADSRQDAVREIVEFCGYLPIAVSLCAGRLNCRQVWTARDLVTELTRTSDRLREIGTEGGNLVSVFETSYRGLDPAQQRLFRRLGLHPAQDFSADAAAALDGIPSVNARRGLEDLSDHNLVEEPRFNRYLLHDLLHEYARSLSEKEDTPEERGQALDRLLDYYIHVASQAESIINLLGSRGHRVEWKPAGTPAMQSHAEAMTWMETERANLHACVRLAIETGRLTRAARLARAMVYFLRLKGYWQDTLNLCETTEGICESVNDRLGLADLAFYRGDIFRLMGKNVEALTQYETSLAAYHELEDQHWRARTLHSIGDIERTEGRYDSALGHYEQALTVYRVLGNTLAEARAIHSIADAYRFAGRSDEAMERFRQLLPMYRALKDEVGEARVLHAIGDLNRHTGRYETALADMQHALSAFLILGDRLGEADTFLNLGEIYQALGDDEKASEHYGQALDLYQELGDQRGKARTQWKLGGLLIAKNQIEEGLALLQHALSAFEALDAIEAREIRAEIDQLGPGEET